MLRHGTITTVAVLLAAISQLWTAVNSRPHTKAQVELDSVWMNYKRIHNKIYDDDIEDSYR
jgi:hypothetical protein